MSDFKGRHFGGDIVLWAVRWYCRYGISYRDLEQMMAERGVSVDHTTIYRWVQEYAPEIEKRLRWQWRCPRSTSWRVDETYVKVGGKWAYLYQAVDKHGNTIDFYLSPTRNTAAAKRFLGKALNRLKDWEKPTVINRPRDREAVRSGHLRPCSSALVSGRHAACLTLYGMSILSKVLTPTLETTGLSAHPEVGPDRRNVKSRICPRLERPIGVRSRG